MKKTKTWINLSTVYLSAIKCEFCFNNYNGRQVKTKKTKLLSFSHKPNGCVINQIVWLEFQTLKWQKFNIKVQILNFTFKPVRCRVIEASWPTLALNIIR